MEIHVQRPRWIINTRAKNKRIRSQIVDQPIKFSATYITISLALYLFKDIQHWRIEFEEHVINFGKKTIIEFKMEKEKTHI